MVYNIACMNCTLYSYLNSSDATVSVSLIGAEEKVPDGEGWIKHRVSI